MRLVVWIATLAVFVPDRPVLAQRTPDQIGEAQPAPTAAEVARLYVQVGRELLAADRKSGGEATVDLWPRYRWIRIQDAITAADKRRDAWQRLESLRRELR